MAERVRNDNDVLSWVTPGHQGTFHILCIINIDVTVDHGDHLQIRERRKSRHNGVFCHSIVRRIHLHHHMIVTAAMRHVDILQSLYLFTDGLEQVCFDAQALAIPDFATGMQHMDNRFFLKTDGFDFHNPAVRAGGVIAADLAEGPLWLADIRQDLRLQDHLGIRDALHIHRPALAQACWLSQQIGCYR